MTPEAQRIALAEACPTIVGERHGKEIKWFWQDSLGTWRPCHHNDPLNDLNAMHAALQSQTQAFRAEFDRLMHALADRKHILVTELKAKDWADCFISTANPTP
jgi:hypothetical protein